LGNLTNLEYLSLYSNQLIGNIPPEMGNLSNLNYLSLYNNQLSGNIPSELGNLTKLNSLIIGYNNLTGGIPHQLGNLFNLIYLHISENQLSGSIPPELGNLNNLEHLQLCNNQISGSIPPELGNLNNLDYLFLYNNQLNGNIPPELGNLANLNFFELNKNQLSGSIPPELGNLVNLNVLNLGNNQLSGSIPPELGDMTNLDVMYLNNNQLRFSIPLELSNLINLYYLNLSHNKLSGAIPTHLTNLTKLTNPNVDIGYNCLYTNDSGLRAWLKNVDPDWESDQNECGFTLTVRSTPDNGVAITVSPNDNYGQGNGTTEFFRTYDSDTKVTLKAPESHNGKNFAKWLINGAENTSQTIQVTMNKDHTVKAVYQAITYTLTVQSFPDAGIDITVSPSDNNGNSDGDTNFTRKYESGTEVTLTAPLTFNGKDFIKWTVDNNDYNDRIVQLTIDSDYTAVVFYSPPPKISVNRDSLNLGYIVGSNNLPGESFTITNSGGGDLNWNVSTEMQRINLSPVSGTNYGEANVSIDPVGLIPGKFKGVIYVADPLATNSPVEVEINLFVKAQANSYPPFGEFSTPVDNSTVKSSVPVTGWALGDTGVESVKIYRAEGKNLVYIGDAVFVEGARPDVEAAYPDYPMNYKAGWGYMMLTNFLPNGGNGTFKIHAIATDIEGHTTTLGIKTITVDNANAVKPFGAIDTPTQGGTASGSSFINWGWVLTPQPNSIPIDGSTIKVWVDGVNKGHPSYNIYRSDIATLFPGYANSNGAAGYFYLDTTAYENGVHTIQWTATNNAGNTDGIGSRYFTIQNTGSASNQRSFINGKMSLVTGHWSLVDDELSSISIDYSKPVKVRKGYNEGLERQAIYPDDEGIINIEIKELERVEFQLEGTMGLAPLSTYTGFLVIGDRLRSLPAGSTLDTKRGIFTWQPGPGFYGTYKFVFIKTDGSERRKVRVLVKISPK
jgi:hypothetical protein